MGAFWLHDVPAAAAAAAAGLNLQLWPGWETRSRSTGGFDKIMGIVVHHTASPPSWSSHRNAQFQWDTSGDRPVANFYIGRSGDVILGCAGASNHAGKGGPYTTSKGTVPLDSGNRYLIGIEAGNDGLGEVWTQAQLAAYVKLVAVLCKLYGLNPLTDVIAHYEWTDRKIDPAGGVGQSPYAKLDDRYLRWDMPRFRQDVKSAMSVSSGGDDMANIAIIRPYGFADQFALVPIASFEQARRMGIEGQQPIVVQADRAKLEAQVGYKLTPKAE